MARLEPGAEGGGSARGDRGPEQEFQLETRHLVLLIALVVVLCAASFMLGRWVERQSLGPPLAGVSRGGTEAKIEDAGDVSKDLTFFDTLQGNEPAPLKPDAAARSSIAVAGTAVREARESAPAPRSTSTSSGGSAGRRSVNDAVMIQVLVSKDRAGADALRKRLRSKGYTVVLVPDRGSYKVRVGPYADREEAERVAQILRDQERLSTWIP